jgi:hypothetical protein
VAALMRTRLRRTWAVALLPLLAVLPRAAGADAGWFESGDSLLRLDLQVLNDAEIIRLPVNQWPMPRAAVEYALANGKPEFAQNAAVMAALERVRARLGAATRPGFTLSGSLTAGEAGLLRDFDSPGREDAELALSAGYTGKRAEAVLRISGVADPADDDRLRLDGSHASVQLGNWLVSANTLDRFWGPAHESSLILSNNARPMPTFMVERAEPRPFESSFLSWLGPWRFNLGVSRMESERADIDSPLFLAWRVVVMPFRDIELGFSRTAQFCGDQLRCDASSVWDMLIGNDNPGFDATEEDEPGNQMAGFDIRWGSPIGAWPYAIYAQMIGEDESGYLPVKYLAQFGIEGWKPMTDGALVRWHAEFSDTTCSFNRSNPRFNCAYNQGAFDVEGYRYKGRVIGHTTDRDAQSYALGGKFVEANGDLWSATARMSRLNRDGSPDTTNTVTRVPADYSALELGWRGRLLGQRVGVDLGVEAFEPTGGERDTQPYGFVSWTYEFRP